MLERAYYYIDKIAFLFIAIIVLFAAFNRPIVNYAAACLLLCYLIYPHKNFQKALKHPLIIGCLVWIAWLIMASLLAQHPATAFDNIKGHNWLLYPLLFFPFLANNHKRIQYLLTLIIGVFIVYLAITYFSLIFLTPDQYLVFHSGYLQLLPEGKADFPLPSSHFNTAIIYIYLVASAYALWHYTSSKWLKIGLALLGLLALYADMSINTSRMGYVTELTLLCLFITLQWRLKGLVSFLIIIAISIPLLYTTSHAFHSRVNQGITNATSYIHAAQQGNAKQLQQAAQTSFGNRLVNLDLMSHKMWQSSWLRNLIGFGPGHYPLLLHQYINHLPKESPYFNIKPVYYGPDNDYFKNWVETGIIGVLLLLAILIYWLYYTRFILVPYKTWAQSGVLIYLISILFVDPNDALLIRIIMLPIFITYMHYQLPTEDQSSNENKDL